MQYRSKVVVHKLWLHEGGNWNNSSSCGPLSRNANNGRGTMNDNNGGRRARHFEATQNCHARLKKGLVLQPDAQAQKFRQATLDLVVKTKIEVSEKGNAQNRQFVATVNKPKEF